MIGPGAWQQVPRFHRLSSMTTRTAMLRNIRSLLFLSVLLGSLSAGAQVLDPPVVNCGSVNVSGDVTLTWTAPADPNGDFAGYEVWHSSVAGGPFTLLTTIPAIGTLTYFHAGAGADIGPQFYCIITLSTGPPPNESIPSDTLATIHLQVFQSTPLGNASLQWAAPAIAPNAAAQFTIWQEYPIGTWTQIGTVPTTTFNYQHVISVCEDSLTFRVGLADASGCVSYSSRDGEVFNDVTPPTVPVLTAVSVDSITGLSGITWSPSPELDTYGYIIVWNGPAGGVIIDTVYGQNNNTYTWPDSYPFDGPESFTIAAFDTCETGTPPSPNTSATGLSHTTIHASTTYDRCAARIRLHWTQYGGWAAQAYQVLVQVDGGSWAVLANVAGDVTSFVHNVEPMRSYCFIVKAVQGAALPSSLSNKTCRYTAYPALPVYNYLRTVTVTGPGSIVVVDSVDASAEVRSYRIERSANGNPYQMVATLPGTLGPVITWTDGDVRPADNGYLYRVLVEDSCGSPAITSNIGANIVLRAVPDLSGFNFLSWSGYIDWAGTVGSYTLYRSIDDGPFEMIATLPADPWEFADDVNAFVGSNGRFCYSIEATEVANPSGIDALSVSNIACAVQEDLIFIPNAFIVDSPFNPIFKPVIGYVDVKTYELNIINRWNQVIWTTNDPEEGWDGVVGSQVAPIGIYAYHCAVTNGAGKHIEKRGIVTLLTARD